MSTQVSPTVTRKLRVHSIAGGTEARDRVAAVPAMAEGRSAPGVAGFRTLRRLGCTLVGCGLALLPWLYVLATTLPATATAAHWSYAWAGLDTLEALGLIATGVPALRGRHPNAPVAAATATLLVVDAWFDTMTAATPSDLTSAVAMAACAELPLAALCTALAVRATRTQRRR
ncbi:hypothetical protein ACWEKM_13515 [Streptomyces sp. NPDC004752]